MRILVILSLTFFAALPAVPQPIVMEAPHSILIESRNFQREIQTERDKPGIITNSLRVKTTGEVLLSPGDVPWFALSVNGQRVTSDDRLWQHRSITQRDMLNGGREFAITWRRTSGALEGLLVTVVIQTYADNDLFRERVVLKAETGKAFQLTRSQDSPFVTLGSFSHPAMSTDSVWTEELRIATWNGQLIHTNYASSFDPKSLEQDWRRGRNLEQNYMYHPKRILSQSTWAPPSSVKGPIFVVFNATKHRGIWMAYEHGSPENDSVQPYISIRTQRGNRNLNTWVSLDRGAFVDRQLLSGSSTYSSVWYTYDIFYSHSISGADSEIWNYLQRHICEIRDSRKPLFYYNTWGMQRDESMRGNDIRGILTEAKLLQEIRDASQLGINLFVLDDGWQDLWGDWNTHPVRFPHGLRFYVDTLNRRGIMPGLWIAPLATDSTAVVTLKHPDWLIRDEKGTPVIDQWQRNFFCFSSAYRAYFVDICKRLIDLGIRYFKWDGVNTIPCSSPLHYHGDSTVSPIQRKDAQGYALPLDITDAIRELKQYRPDLIVEIDVTEPNRNVGLAYLSEARYFWMNNGASWYGDYSTYRAKSMRMITNLYGSFMPTTLQTFANFPMYDPVYKAQHHNVNSSLIGGRGLWGNIARMTPAERERAGKLVRKAQRVESIAAEVRPSIVGSVGSSPEIYVFVDTATSAGKVIAFSGSAMKTTHCVRTLRTEQLLGVIDNAYDASGDSLVLHLDFYAPDDTKEAILLPNNGGGISIVSSTCWLDSIGISRDGHLEYVNGAPGQQTIRWSAKKGEPSVTSDRDILSSVTFDERSRTYHIAVTTTESLAKVVVKGAPQKR